MSTNLLFNFSVNREMNMIYVQREFAAPKTKVWAAWTQSEILDQWWAPKPYRSETKKMDFHDGGEWLYAMISPEQEKHWSRADFSNIKEGESFSAFDAFCDEEGNESPDMPRAFWHISFVDRGEKTLVDIAIKYDQAEDLEKILEMGFKEGFALGLGNLDELLAK